MNPAQASNSPISLHELADQLRGADDQALQSAVQRHGPLATRVAMLALALEERLRQPRIRNYPPAVFLAYKWGEPEHHARVSELAAHLRGRGYRVLLDRDHLADGACDYTEVPRYIATMVSCDVFLMVLTERYVDMVTARSGHTTWVHDEYSAAVTLHNEGRLRLLGLRTDPAVAVEGTLFNVPIVEIDAGLDRAFPAYRGPVLEPSAWDRFRVFVVQFDALVRSNPFDPESMKRLLIVAYPEFGELYEHRIRVGYFCFLVNDLETALFHAKQLTVDCNSDDDAMMLARILDAAGDMRGLFRFLHMQRRAGRLRKSLRYTTSWPRPCSSTEAWLLHPTTSGARADRRISLRRSTLSGPR